MTRTAYFDRLLSLSLSEFRPGSPIPNAGLESLDAILVLGHQLEDDGGLKPRLVARLEAARALAEASAKAPLVLTGGKLGTVRSEADAMANWLIARGLPAARLHLEEQATDTLENAAYSLPILRRIGAHRVALVSSTYHVRRSLILLHALADRRGDGMEFLHLAAADPSRPTPLDGASKEEIDLITADFARAMDIDLSRYDGP
ncbi:YdcF family protein [Pleomorphomonas sp. PLEO]|uniref:YdcF family protein n=1 Tax=Pleomorphomonas sp. PLEO TaxID=3239306 RepID=UPI00351E5C08